MGTASTMNAGRGAGHVAALLRRHPRALSRARPDRLRHRQAHRRHGLGGPEPSDILTRKAFENCIVANSAIGGSTNAPIHINAIARHIGVKLDIQDWETVGHEVPLMVNMQPAGAYLGEEYYRAGGLPAVMNELLKAGKIHGDAITANGKTMGENVKDAVITDPDVIRPYAKPLVKDAGFIVLKGNLFDSAIMKTSVISADFRKRYLSNPKDPDAFEGGPSSSRGRRTITTGSTILRSRSTRPASSLCAASAPLGYPARRRVVNMQPPAALLKKGIRDLPCIGDGRQSGTSGSPSLHPQCLARGRRQWRARRAEDRRPGAHRPQEALGQHPHLRGGVRRPHGRAQGEWRLQGAEEPDALAGDPALDGEPARRRHGPEPAVKYQKIAQKRGIPRDNH